jgi:hypothetical protein
MAKPKAEVEEAPKPRTRSRLPKCSICGAQLAEIGGPRERGRCPVSDSHDRYDKEGGEWVRVP